MNTKEKLMSAIILMSAALPAMASVDPATAVPEPSTLGLFVAAAIAITVLAKFRK